MKRILLASAALALPFGMTACSSAGLTESESAAVQQTAQQSEAMKEEISELNRLTRIYIDAAALYKQAADIPDEKNGLKPVLLDLAKKRNAQRDLLQARVITLGGNPAEHGQALGTMHRSFTAMRTIVDKDTEVAVEEVLRGERYLLEEINKAMDAAVTPDTRSMLAQLRTDADAQIARLEALK
ncbi:PA2169 family four-helix-bundle protein [Henriciella sp.]|uniref:PA2169 family four-helix-bundle protein n=1 Tax=Henriciella sp. TaxID=1968823 RepID=UPI0026201CD5|nr:PA2169 family four-helix-bundle protein [Henriciella sp.]